MRLDVIHLSCNGVLPTLQTIHTPWFPGKLRRSHGSPRRTVVQLLDRRIADEALRRVSSTSPTLDQYIAAWLCALAQGCVWHRASGGFDIQACAFY